MDENILARIHDFVQEEHELRAKASQGQPLSADDEARLRDIEEHLDQCWDLLRQRRARRDSGMDPEDAEARPVTQVESYLQ